ncbi:MAG: hypothetical protein ABFC88_13170 [Thermoguttaceae bacterium]
MKTTLFKGKILQEGLGGFLCPPDHPMHTCHVKAARCGDMSLDAALECKRLHSETKATVRSILAKWEQEKRPLDAAETREWILQVLGYFRGCYCRGDGSRPEDWHAANVVINGIVRPNKVGREATIDRHAGVHLIRQYYPDYQPTADDFDAAHWGEKPI